MKTKNLVVVLMVVALSISILIPRMSAADTRADALVLVNSSSPSYLHFQYYIQPYLDNFGIPYTVLDIASSTVPADIGEYAVIIVGHRQLDPGGLLDETEQGLIAAAVNAGTGLVNFDNDLWAGASSSRYPFIHSIFGFGYVPPSTGSGVTFTSLEGGGGYQINCWEDDHQSPILPTITQATALNPNDDAWDEFQWTGRSYPGVFAGYEETPPLMHFYSTVPNGEYTIVAHLYWAHNLRYFWGYTADAPLANHIDITSGNPGEFGDYTLGTVTVDDGQFDIYVQNADPLDGGQVNQFWGWAWIRLVPVGGPPPVMHYITARHQAGESISTGGMTMAGITLPTGVTALSMTGSQPFLAVADYGSGRAVQWGTYNWMSHSVKGPIYGLDDLVWRSIVWAARKPFVMQAMPPFLTMRVDDVSEPHQWIDIANEFGFKPWLGLFINDIDVTESDHLRTLTHEGRATASIHAFGSGTFFYRDRNNNEDFTDAELDANFAAGLKWHQERDIPIAKFMVPHFGEVSVNAVPRLNQWGIELIGTMPELGAPWGSSWTIGGPYRHNPPTPPGASSSAIPFYSADYMRVPDIHPEWNQALFNCVSEVRDIGGYEWYPSASDIPGTVSRGTQQLKREFDSLVLPTLFTHEYFLPAFTDANWRAALQAITDNVASYSPIYVTMDYACQYARAIYDSDITATTYDPVTGQLTTTFGGQTDMPTKFYLFVEDAGTIRDMLIDVPPFSIPTQVAFTIPGPLDHIAVTPDSAIVATGGTQQFSAQGFDKDNNPIPDLTFTWSIAGGGTISSGLFTAGLAPGQHTIRASFGEISGEALVEVVAPVPHHFTFEPIASPEYIGAPFKVTIKALDVSGNLLVGYFGQASLSDTTDTIVPSETGNFGNGQWTGDLTIGIVAHNVIVTATDNSVTGSSNPIEFLATPMFYQVISPSYEHYTGDSFPVTVTVYPGITINCWEDNHQDPVLVTTEVVAELTANYAAGRWTEFLYTPSRNYPDITASALHTDTLPTMRFYATGIPNGQYQVIANLYDNARMRYFYGYESGDPRAYFVDTLGGATGSQHREYNLSTVNITNNSFNIYVNHAQQLGTGFEGFGWAWIRLVPLQLADIQINCWENDHQDPELPTLGTVSSTNGEWDEFSYSGRPFPAVFAGHDEWETLGLEPIHFFSDAIPNGTYEVWAKLYTANHNLYSFGFNRDEAIAQTRWVETVKSAETYQFSEYSLGTVTVTDGRFDLWAGDGDPIGEPAYYYGWAWIRLVPTGLVMTSSSSTMLFDANGNGIFGEPDDNIKQLVGGTFTIMTRDTTPGTDVPITATDVWGQYGYNIYTTIAVNSAPVLGAIGNQTVNEMTELSFTATATDPDLPGDMLIFGLVGAPTGATIDLTTGAFTWTPTEAQGPDSYTFTVKVCDAGSPPLCDEEAITATVGEVNLQPVLNPIGPKSVNEGIPLTFTATATDADIPANMLTFSLTGTIPAGANIDPGTGAFTWTPTEAQGPGSHTFTIKVCDNGTSVFCDEETITVTVNEVNIAPVLGAIGNKTVDEETTLTFNATASDPDVPANTLSFSLVGAPAGAGIDPTSGAFTWTPTEEQGPDSCTFTVKVCDNGVPSLCGKETITVTVDEVNVAPVLAGIGNREVQWSDLLTFTATATDSDLPANTLAFSLIDAPEGASIGEDTGVFTWTPTSQQIHSYTFTVRVTDSGTPNLFDEESITVVVGKRATTLVYTGATEGQYSDAVELSVTLTDAGTGSPISERTVDFVLGSQSASGTTDSSGVATVTLLLEQPAGSYTVSASFAEDGGYLDSSDSGEFIVNPEDADVAFDETNQVAVKVVEPGGDSGLLSLIAYISEFAPDAADGTPNAGEINLATVAMTLSPVGPGSPIEPAPGGCALKSNLKTGYSETLTLTCIFNNVPVNTYTVQVTVNGGYFAGYAEDVLVVYDPSLGFATGGGWFFWPMNPEEEPPYEDYPGDRTNFGFTMKYNKKGTNVQGSLLLIRHLADGTIYRVKSNALYGLALGQDTTVPLGWASFSGKATYLEPGWTEPIGNYEFIVYVEDRNEPGHGEDRFWIEVKNQAREVIGEMSMGRDSERYVLPIEIQGGNIVVPHR